MVDKLQTTGARRGAQGSLAINPDYKRGTHARALLWLSERGLLDLESYGGMIQILTYEGAITLGSVAGAADRTENGNQRTGQLIIEWLTVLDGSARDRAQAIAEAAREFLPSGSKFRRQSIDVSRDALTLSDDEAIAAKLAAFAVDIPNSVEATTRARDRIQLKRDGDNIVFDRRGWRPFAGLITAAILAFEGLSGMLADGDGWIIVCLATAPVLAVVSGIALYRGNRTTLSPRHLLLERWYSPARRIAWSDVVDVELETVRYGSHFHDDVEVAAVVIRMEVPGHLTRYRRVRIPRQGHSAYGMQQVIREYAIDRGANLVGTGGVASGLGWTHNPAFGIVGAILVLLVMTFGLGICRGDCGRGFVIEALDTKTSSDWVEETLEDSFSDGGGDVEVRCPDRVFTSTHRRFQCELIGDAVFTTATVRFTARKHDEISYRLS